MNASFDTSAAYYDPDACDLHEFTALIDQSTRAESVPYAFAIEENIPLYDIASLRSVLADRKTRRQLMAEWAQVLRFGAGVVILKKTYADTSVLDKATRVFERIIEEEKQGSGGGGDHFAAAGSNDRIWNSLQKLCLKAPDVHFDYFANTAIAAICEAWLGPNYQMTAQVNLVYPGGAAQQAHRDYHLGFQSSDVSASYPAHVHEVSPVLTLQGAVAHCDMPLESGPTKLLPFSQAYRPGYAAWRRDDFRELFEQRYVQLPLAKGDTLFFSPALFHAAGSNTSKDIHRLANLLQVSSAFGRAMETIDRDKMCRAVFSPAMQAVSSKRFTAAEVSAAIAATAEGYSFPTNLDLDPPTNGLAPQTQAELFARALSMGISTDEFENHLDRLSAARRA